RRPGLSSRRPARDGRRPGATAACLCVSRGTSPAALRSAPATRAEPDLPRPHPDPRTAQKNAIPRLRVPDSTLSLLREGYGFISRRCDRLGTDAFRTRLMGSRVVAMRGGEAARLVYDSGRFGRWKAMPVLTLRLLQDHGSVQLLEGGAHRVRKGMFLDLMTPLALDRARTILAREF